MLQVCSKSPPKHSTPVPLSYLWQVGTELQRSICWDDYVHPEAPPTFLWHTVADSTVPVENSYQMAIALQQAQIPHELHVFPCGEHGIGLGTIHSRRQGSADQWRGLAERWLRELNF